MKVKQKISYILKNNVTLVNNNPCHSSEFFELTANALARYKKNN